MKFKVGDKVRIVIPTDNNYYGIDKRTYEKRLRGKVDTIASCSPVSETYSLANEPFVFREEMLELKKPQPIIIYQQDEKTVVALDKNTGEKAIAICAEEDEFCFKTGAKIAFGRLTETSLELDVEAKRKWLFRFCQKHSCRDCILTYPTCRCGYGTHFNDKHDGVYEMTDEEINLAYTLVKEHEKNEQGQTKN